MQQNLREAERRIGEARRTGAESLDLGDLALSELPASLGNLPRLRKLSLGLDRLAETGEFDRDYGRESSPFTDLSPLAGLAGLQVLDLSHTRVRDLSPLAGLAGLRSLDLQFCPGVSDLSPLAGLSRLQSLDLEFCRGIADLSPLSGLAGLQSLGLSSTGVADLSPLAGLTELQSLTLARTGVTDVSVLAGFPRLQSLDLSGTGVTDLSLLSGLPGLERLFLSGLSVTDLSPLAGLAELERLHLYNCRPAIPATLLRVLADHPRLAMLVADEAVGVPREVLSHSPSDDCLPRLRAHLADLALGPRRRTRKK